MRCTLGSLLRSCDVVNNIFSMLKLKTGRLAREITDSCLQFWGGMGFTDQVSSRPCQPLFISLGSWPTTTVLFAQAQKNVLAKPLVLNENTPGKSESNHGDTTYTENAFNS